MATYYIEFWRGRERVGDFESDEFSSPDEARQHIDDMLGEITLDSWVEDWTGCRFEVATADGETVFSVPVLTAMSAIARRRSH